VKSWLSIRDLTLVAVGAAAVACSSNPAPRPDAASADEAASADATMGCGVPAHFAWSTGGPVLSPASDAKHSVVAVKDPSIVYFNGKYHMFVSTVDAKGAYSMAYVNFPDWGHTADATFAYLDQTPTLVGYHTSPEIFFFAPQNKWYLVFQSGQPQYSTNDDIENPAGWTKPTNFYVTEPAIVTQTAGASGGWLDFWVICDDTNCYLFFTDDNGHWYRGQTTVDAFPQGFSDPVVALRDDANPTRVFEASNVYKLSGTNKYLGLIEAFDGDSSYKRYYRSWTADTLDGEWTPLQDSFAAPFAGTSNTTFTTSPAWTQDISSGEMVRDGHDQHLSVDPCHLQYVYQGVDPATAGLPYNSLPWQVGLLTKQ
jgi:endo-1,4-beta-xylanase